MPKYGYPNWSYRRRLGALAAVGLVSGLALSAHAGLRAVANRAQPAAISTRPTGYEVQEHFPGAALFYADLETQSVDLAAPAAGVTGTTMLPAVPVNATQAVDFGTTRVAAAAPFLAGSASAVDRGRAMECLTAAIYYEAASEPDAGQQAVAQVILNRARHPAFPATICGVVYQGSEKAGCQFSFACDGAIGRTPSRAGWVRAARTAAIALAGRVYAPVGLATHYHTYAVTPAWNRSLVMTDVVGAHFFHRWKGYWGTVGAFHQRYVGNEPMPGPHRSTVVPDAVIPAGTTAIPMGQTIAALPAILPPVEPARKVPPAIVLPDNLPPASEILDRWKDSGKPVS